MVHQLFIFIFLLYKKYTNHEKDYNLFFGIIVFDFM